MRALRNHPAAFLLASSPVFSRLRSFAGWAGPAVILTEPAHGGPIPYRAATEARVTIRRR